MSTQKNDVDFQVKSTLEVVKRAWKSPTRLTVSEWADRERVLSSESCAEPGRWNTLRIPYQKGIMDALSDPRIETIVIMSSAQIGKTEIINNIVGYFIDQEPSPILLIQPTLEMGQAWSKDRLAPMLRDTPCLRGKVKDTNNKETHNTILHKIFPGGHITICGANSAASLAARPIRILLCDEVDKYPASAGIEGDPVSLAFKRTTTFWNRKRIVASTPTIRGKSRIEKFWEGSDKRRYFVPCPHCGEYQVLYWKNIKFEKDVDGRVILSVYVCEYCQKDITDADKPLFLRKGEWRAEAPFINTAGFHINELYSTAVSFTGTVETFLEAKKEPFLLQVWVNNSLGETWEEGDDEVDEKTIVSRKEEYPKLVEHGQQVSCLPDGVLVLTAGVDIQDDRLEVEVVGWGVGEESWNVDYQVLFGDPAKIEVWQQLDNVLLGTYLHQSGMRMRISATCIDTGGHHTQQVYSFVKPRQVSRVFAIRGANQAGQPIVGRYSRNNNLGVKLFPIGVDTAKEVVFTRLKITEFGYGYMHFPKERDDEYFAQLTAENPVTKFVRGRQSRVWVKKRARNEALDCRIYALAALYILNPNLKMIATQMEEWQKREEAKGTEQKDVSVIKRDISHRRKKQGWVKRWE